MSQQLPPGWVDAISHAVASGDEKTRSEALGVRARRCFRFNSEDVARSRKRGTARGQGGRWVLKNLPPIEDDEP